MKDLSLLVWLTQLGLSVAFPLAGCVLLAVWLREKFGLGAWPILVGVFLGIVLAIDGLRTSLRAMERSGRQGKDHEPPPLSFNEHD